MLALYVFLAPVGVCACRSVCHDHASHCLVARAAAQVYTHNIIASGHVQAGTVAMEHGQTVHGGLLVTDGSFTVVSGGLVVDEGGATIANS